MEITSVKVNKITKKNSKVKGFASITIDDCFVITNILIIEGEQRLFAAMPSKKSDHDGRFYDIAFPINQETRELIENKILREFYKVGDNCDKDNN